MNNECHTLVLGMSYYDNYRISRFDTNQLGAN